MDEWGTPAQFFVDLLVRWFTVQFVVYLVIRNVVGHALQFLTKL